MSNSKLDSLKSKLLDQERKNLNTGPNDGQASTDFVSINSTELFVKGAILPNPSCNNPSCSVGYNDTCTNPGCSTSGQQNVSCTNTGCVNG